MPDQASELTALKRDCRDLLIALRKQHFCGRAPGQYAYSSNVVGAMRRVEDRVKLPAEELAPLDEAKDLTP